jgi:hypothetical protein
LFGRSHTHTMGPDRNKRRGIRRGKSGVHWLLCFFRNLRQLIRRKNKPPFPCCKINAAADEKVALIVFHQLVFRSLYFFCSGSFCSAVHALRNINPRFALSLAEQIFIYMIEKVFTPSSVLSRFSASLFLMYAHIYLASLKSDGQWRSLANWGQRTFPTSCAQPLDCLYLGILFLSGSVVSHQQSSQVVATYLLPPEARAKVLWRHQRTFQTKVLS